MALRTPLSVTPHLYMGDSTGRPLDMGTVYFGEQDKDPEFYPINLFSDDALTLPLAQPVHTKGGYLYDKGDMVEPHAKEIIYSVKVLDSYGRKVFYKGAMMRNSWNDDVIQQINTAIIESQAEAQVVFDNAATDVKNKAIAIVNDAINNTAVEGGVLADTFVTVTSKNGSTPRTQASKNAETVSVKDFGAKGDGVTDDTAAFQAAVDTARRIFVPKGDYRVYAFNITKSNIEIFGEGDATRITRINDNFKVSSHTAPFEDATHIIAINAYDLGTDNPEDNVKNIYIHDLMLDGRLRDLKHNNWAYNILGSAVSNLRIERVHFFDFCGDGLALMSTTFRDSIGNVQYERHNEHVTVRDCIFDGHSMFNRNGISIIDCNGLTVDNCVFKNIGHPELSTSVGAIDFEPDLPYTVIKNVVIRSCKFYNISKINTSAITIFNQRQTIKQNISGFLIDDCYFEGCYWGISLSTSFVKDERSVRDDVTIQNCTMVSCLSRSIRVNGAKGVQILHNTFRQDYSKDNWWDGSDGFSDIAIGSNLRYAPAVDIQIKGNTFESCATQWALLAIYSVNGLDVSDNTFHNIEGWTIFLKPGGGYPNISLFRNISITSNRFSKSAVDGVISTAFQGINVADGINSESDATLINSSCVFKDNTFDGQAMTVFLNKLNILGYPQSKPTVGTWESNSVIYKDREQLSGVRCSVSGTFGILDGVVGNTNAGSPLLTEVVDPNKQLQVGNFIKVGGQIQRIIYKDSDTQYVLSGSSSSTMEAAEITWSPPVFVDFNSVRDVPPVFWIPVSTTDSTVIQTGNNASIKNNGGIVNMSFTLTIETNESVALASFGGFAGLAGNIRYPNRLISDMYVSTGTTKNLKVIGNGANALSIVNGETLERVTWGSLSGYVISGYLSYTVQ